MRTLSYIAPTLCALACAWLAAAPAHAQFSAPASQYHVTMDTSSLAAQLNSVFSLDFQFNDGGTPNNNTAILSNFTFGGGSAAPSPSGTTGGASGNVNSMVTIADSGLLNELTQTFTPGQRLAFNVSVTNNANPAPGSSPDEFSFALLDGSGNEIATTAPNNAFVTIDTGSPNPIVTTAGTPVGATYTIPAPQAAPVPEARSLVSLAALLGAFGIAVRRRRAVTPH